MNKQLLISVMPFFVKPEMIREASANPNKTLTVQGVLQRANSRNQNGRIYPRETLQREVKKYFDLVKERQALGELDHPDSSTVNLANVSHLIKEVWWEGDDVVGKIDVLGTPAGNILRELFKSGVKVGISSRGLGTVEEVNGASQVQDDFELIAWDFVSNPSTQGAFMNPINEGKKSGIIHSPYREVNEVITELLLDLKCEYEGKCDCNPQNLVKGRK